MSITLKLVTPHELHNTDNHEACKKFLQQTTDRLSNYFNDKRFITDIVAEREDLTEEREETKYQFIEYSFELSILDTNFYLHKGILGNYYRI